MNIIGDIAGQYDTLMALLKQMPDDTPFSVGDMVDRGPKSREVLDFFMKNGRAILGNHEHMMACANGYKTLLGKYRYDNGLWKYHNGGLDTLESFGFNSMSDMNSIRETLEPYLKWIDTLPAYEITEETNRYGEKLFMSHAPVCPMKKSYKHCMLDEMNSLEDSLIWNRETPPKKMDGMFQVFGHNSWQGGKSFTDAGNIRPYAMCLDKSSKNVLMGMHWPSMEIFEQPYI